MYLLILCQFLPLIYIFIDISVFHFIINAFFIGNLFTYTLLFNLFILAPPSFPPDVPIPKVYPTSKGCLFGF